MATFKNVTPYIILIGDLILKPNSSIEEVAHNNSAVVAASVKTYYELGSLELISGTPDWSFADMYDCGIIQHTTVEWALLNTTLPNNVIGYDVDLDIIKIGDGVTAWAGLSTVAGGFTVYDLDSLTTFPAAAKGDFYRVGLTGMLGGGLYVTEGDLLYCNTDSASGNYATVGTNWDHYYNGTFVTSNITETDSAYAPSSAAVYAALANKAATTHTHSSASTSAAGFMSASDKIKLDGLTQYTDSDTLAACVTSSITNGDTTHAPDGNSVFDALALKASISHTHYSGVHMSLEATEKPSAGGVYSYFVPSNLTIPEDCTGSAFYNEVNPSAEVVVSVKNNGTEFATITVSAAGVATWVSDGVILSAGARVSFVFPGTQDSTWEGIVLMLRGEA